MAHELETFEDGSAAFYAFREKAWHNLGTITADAATADEALHIAKLDWEVAKYPIYATAPDGTPTEIPNKFATARMHNELGFNPLGIVGNYYTPVQNTEAFAFCDNLAFEGGLTFDTAGSLAGGSRVFMAMKVPQHITIAGGKDRVDLYIMVTNSHDGTSPLTAAVTPIRPVCANTVAAALNGAISTYKVRHTRTATQRVSAAREALGITLNYADEFSLMANRLFEEEMSKHEYATFLNTLLPKPEPKENGDTRATTMWEARFNDIIALWDAPTQENIKGTAWAAYNAVIEYADWIAPVRGDQPEIRRAERIITGLGDTLKHRALALLTA